MIFFYMLMGDYDIATLMEVPDDATAEKIELSLGQLGDIRTRTYRAFTEAETREIIGGLG